MVFVCWYHNAYQHEFGLLTTNANILQKQCDGTFAFLIFKIQPHHLQDKGPLLIPKIHLNHGSDKSVVGRKKSRLTASPA